MANIRSKIHNEIREYLLFWYFWRTWAVLKKYLGSRFVDIDQKRVWYAP